MQPRALLALGATVRLAPVNYPWGRELHILDPDGNVLRFGSDVVPGEPLGTWLDMRGILWEMSASGWTRATHE